MAARKVRCLRDGRWGQCLSEELVQDDVVEFYAGDQIVADAVVLAGSAQVNESLLTGEARPVPKTEGGELRSGSFLMAGHCTARLTRVGDESYASRLTAQAQADYTVRVNVGVELLDMLDTTVDTALKRNSIEALQVTVEDLCGKDAYKTLKEMFKDAKELKDKVGDLSAAFRTEVSNVQEAYSLAVYASLHQEISVSSDHLRPCG